MLKKVFFSIFIFLTIYIVNAFLKPVLQKYDNNFRPQYGVSYSFEQAAWFGLDPRQSFLKLIDGGRFDWVRLPYFWNDPRLDDLKFAIEEAEKRNVKVIIALGAKTPYYPEFHWSSDVASQVKFGEMIGADSPVASKIIDLDRQVVEVLSAYDNIAYWQVENEPLTRNVNKWLIEPSLISKEIEAVRSADPLKRHVILTFAAGGSFDNSWRELAHLLKPGDVLATNAYFETQGIDIIDLKLLGREIRIPWPSWFTWPVQSWVLLSPDYGHLKKEIEAQGLGFWVMEMQAEPYNRVRVDADRSRFPSSPADVTAADRFLRSYKIKSIGLWGANFWQYRQSIGDASWIDAVKKITKD